MSAPYKLLAKRLTAHADASGCEGSYSIAWQRKQMEREREEGASAIRDRRSGEAAQMRWLRGKCDANGKRKGERNGGQAKKKEERRKEETERVERLAAADGWWGSRQR